MNPNVIAEWMVARFTQRPGLAAFGGRFFPDVAPPSTPNPCAIYQLIDGNGEAMLDVGASGEGTIAYQIRIYDDRRLTANALRESFRRAFQNVEPQDILDGDGKKWRITGSSYGELADTHETTTSEYGALAVIEVHLESA